MEDGKEGERGHGGASIIGMDRNGYFSSARQIIQRAKG